MQDIHMLKDVNLTAVCIPVTYGLKYMTLLHRHGMLLTLQVAFVVSTPSMRIESITKDILVSLRKSGLKTLTIAPESIESIRKKINKDIPDEKIFEVGQSRYVPK